MKSNISFFTHLTEAPDNRKFLMLRAYYGGALGWAMEAKFWALNCLIGEADGCRLDTNRKGEKAKIARTLELSLTELEAFIAVLRDEAELIKDDAGVLWTKQTQEDLERAIQAREGAKDRRSKRKDTPSHDESKTSGDESKTSGDEMHGGKGGDRIGQDKRGGGGEAPSALVENSPEAEEAALFAFALARIKSRKKQPGDPEAMARKIMREEDVIRDFRASLVAKDSPAIETPPEPGPCPKCGGERIARYPGDAAVCAGCSSWFHYDETWKSWEEDPAQADTG
jgi:hypothetical protein